MSPNKLVRTMCMAYMVFCFSTAIASVECTLTTSNPSYEKNVACSGPKVLYYTLQARAGGTGFGYVRFNCDVYIDGQKLNKTHCFTYYNYSGYYSQAWQYQDAKTQRIYLSSGNHTVKWSISVPNWMDTYNPQVSVIDYTLAAIPSYDSLYDWAKATYEEETWIANSLSGVIENYDATISANPADYEARISRALAKVAQLGDNTTLRSLIAQFGFIPDDFMQYVTGEFAGFDNIPQPNLVIDTVSTETLSAIDSALLDLSEIPEDWSGVIALNPEKYSMLSDTTYIDNAELMMLRSALNAVRGLVQLVDGYDFSADYVTVSNAYAESSQQMNVKCFFDIFDAMPDVGNIRDIQKVANAKEYFRSALLYLQKTDAAIVARKHEYSCFLEYDSADADDIVEARKVLDKVIASLDEVTTIDGRYFADKYGSTIDLPNGFVRQLYLGALFAGQVTRECVGTIIDDSEYAYLRDAVNLCKLLPDPTFGGVAPDVTISEVVSVYSGSQYFNISDYISLSPKLKLTLGNRLVVEGVAAKNGNVEFNIAATGLVVCYVNGNRVLEFNPWMEEATSEFSFPVAAGDRYAVDFMPVSMNWPVLEITEPTKLIDFISVPSPLPDGGPYAERVNGVEWLFMVNDSKAIVGTDEYTAVDRATSGAVEIPATLGSRPVAEIADGAFAWCKNISSLILPATIEKIGDSPFYKCNSLAAITFYGNKPSYVHDDAFSHLLSECIFHVTRAANWDGVTIPGTWKGHNIDYVAGYNPVVTVASSVADGTRFEESQSIELSAGDNQTIYYTTDGSDPLTSDTRSVYTSPLSITGTTTLNYCSVDNATGDWSEIKTATYELIVRMPVGGPYTEVIDGVPWQYYVVEAGADGIAPYYSGASLTGIDTTTSDFFAKGTINIPSRLGEHPVVEISMFNIPASGFSAVKKITIPYTVKCIWGNAMSLLIIQDPMTFQYPPYCNTTTYPGFVAIDGWIVARDNQVMELSGKVDLETARGISEMVAVADSTTTSVILPSSLEKITTSLGLDTAPYLSELKIPDSVTSVDLGLLSSMQPSLLDIETFPGFSAIDGWIYRDAIDIAAGGNSRKPEYCDLSVARGIGTGFKVRDYYLDMKTLILPSTIKSIGGTLGFNISGCNRLENLYIPEGVTNIGMGAIMNCPYLKTLYIPRSAENTTFQDWLTGLETLYLPDSMRARLETWDDALGMRPIDFIQNANTSCPIEVIYYSTDRYQHAINFDANGGSVSESVRKVNRGNLVGSLPTPVKAGFSFSGWTLDKAGKNAFDTTKIVISDFTLYAQWDSAYNGAMRPDGRFALTEIVEEPVNNVFLPSVVDGCPVKILGRNLMRGEGQVVSVHVPESVIMIEASVFRECSRLESVELPEGLTEIGDNAFRECVSLRSITIPASVTNIGYFAFRDCLRLETVNLLGDPPRHDLGAYMGVPAFTVISGRLGSATAIIYASVTNSTDEITVPEGWLDEIALAHEKPAGYESYQAAFEDKFGSNLEEALKKPTGKTDLHGNALYVWQDYVAGTDPLDEEDKFTAIIKIENGLPVVEWKPELPPDKAALRKYTTLGATALGGEWVDVSSLSDVERQAAGYQFFQVTVEMK